MFTRKARFVVLTGPGFFKRPSPLNCSNHTRYYPNIFGSIHSSCVSLRYLSIHHALKMLYGNNDCAATGGTCRFIYKQALRPDYQPDDLSKILFFEACCCFEKHVVQQGLRERKS